MRVNIKGKWYDSELEPIAIELTKFDKKNIKGMLKTTKTYVSFPDKMKWEKAQEKLKI